MSSPVWVGEDTIGQADLLCRRADNKKQLFELASAPVKLYNKMQ